jgi:predicted nucleic acid-binding protein
LIDEYGRVYADARANGLALGAPAQANDRWIAATARLLAVGLLTRNRRDFHGLPGLVLG